MDSAYLEANVADALVAGLASTVQEQPADSVAFLGNFLVKFADTMRLKAKLAGDDAQEEVDRKEAAEKAAAETKAAAPAVAAAKAAEAADAKLDATLDKAAKVDGAVLGAVVSHVQSVTGATGVYIAVKQPPAEGEEAGDDEEGGGGSLKYIAATEDHGDVLDKTLKAPAGVTFPVWQLPPKPEDEEEEEEDDEDEPKAKPPPPELQPLHIRNVLRSTAEFYRIPRIGAYLAVPFSFDNLTHPDAIPPPEEKEEADEKEEEEGEEGAGAAASAEESKEAPIPPGRAIVTHAAVCLDTMGQNRPFTDAEIAAVKAWATKLGAAMSKSEQAQYEENYVRHQQELAAAAEEAAKAEAAGGEEAEQ